MVVAVCALVFAMVGSAVAGTDGLSNKITKAKVKKIAKKQISKAAPGLSVGKCRDIHQGTVSRHGDTGRQGNAGRQGNDGRFGHHRDQRHERGSTRRTRDTADNATNADNADNADALGGLAANNYVRRFFAKVAYSNATPTLIAASPGVTASGEGALGFRGTFPQSMTNCAIIATTSSSRWNLDRRHSSAAPGPSSNSRFRTGPTLQFARPRAASLAPSLVRLLWAAAGRPWRTFGPGSLASLSRVSRYTSATDADRAAMLDDDRRRSADELFADIPAELRLDRPLELARRALGDRGIRPASRARRPQRRRRLGDLLHRRRHVRPLRARRWSTRSSRARSSSRLTRPISRRSPRAGCR